ncbi:PREDICTED: TSC22 domain family protein 1 isoform X1 [Nanorana parkeri]|uniref:TSC22 domain family protein 1 isoform X1 n=1 Tax=Nanorana parkeri TaxID=125878 RepID=UPI000854F245|nr:PREDICTED: TSC22 domain family protein 1 isoform X1 [Nanorana parkeri]
MHQPDPSADLSARKMAHPADVPRRGSGATGIPSPLTLTSGLGVGGHMLSSDDYQPSMLVQPPPVSSSSPGPQQHPPQTLNLMPQTLGQSGAQMKKKSGFQITSVTPAQISASMSSNNSIAEDTESYDDLDESHTEDLSSSEILDVSLSRATDLGGPERSSSEETLNNFQEAETPGAVSPNQPHLQHLPSHVQQNIMINGNVHHPHHLHHHHHGLPTATHHGLPSASLSGTSLNTAVMKLATQGSTDSAVTIGPVSSAPPVAVPNVGTVPPITRNASGPVSTGINPVPGSSTSHNVNIQNVSGVTGPLSTNVNVNSTNVTSASNVSAVSGHINTNVTLSGNGSVASSNIPNNVSTAAVGSATGSAAAQQQPAAPLAVTSRFRVVKLDSSTEPFKKGRWTCMEFYDKENTAAASEGAVVNKAVESVKQNPLEVTSERESTSGSSVSSNISTLSHYTESVGSGEMGAPAMQGFQTLGPQQMDFSNALPQNVPASNIPQSVSQPQLAQLQMHSQDATYSPQKQVGHAATTSINPAVGVQPTAVGVQPATVNILGVPSSLGHQQPAVPAMIPQQLPYPPQTQPIQTLPTVPQQQLQYAHQQTAPTQLTTGHVMPANQSSVPGNLPEYLQHPQILQTAVGPVQSNSAAVGSTSTVPVVQGQVLQVQMQSSPAQPPPTCVAPTQPVVHAQTTMPATGSQVVGVVQQGSLPAPASQSTSSVVQQNVPPTQQVLPPTQGIQVGASVHPQPVMIAPQNPLLPSKPPTQLLDPAVQGMTNQQAPAVSPIPAAANVPSVPQLNTSIPSGISPATTTLGPPPNVTQLPTAQNGNLVQSGSQAHVMPSFPFIQNIPLHMLTATGQFLGTSFIQSVANQIEDARRLEHAMVGFPHVGEGAPLDGNIQGSGSLLPLRSLPLTTPLVDGEDDSSSGASVVAIDNKIEQAMDLVKSHLMYAVREEVEVLKEQIKELIEKNSQLEQENSLLKTLASPEQLAQFQAQLQNGSPPSSSSSQPVTGTPAPTQPATQSSGPSA